MAGKAGAAARAASTTRSAVHPRQSTTMQMRSTGEPRCGRRAASTVCTTWSFQLSLLLRGAWTQLNATTREPSKRVRRSATLRHRPSSPLCLGPDRSSFCLRSRHLTVSSMAATTDLSGKCSFQPATAKYRLSASSVSGMPDRLAALCTSSVKPRFTSSRMSRWLCDNVAPALLLLLLAAADSHRVVRGKRVQKVDARRTRSANRNTSARDDSSLNSTNSQSRRYIIVAFTFCWVRATSFPRRRPGK
mmetsp:Transcript_22099/g.68029  ORF Transcript_22099/g.68029 Transcript_22099/m.68029 type:complete len:247 (-) Transcript_22099:167-907(-)